MSRLRTRLPQLLRLWAATAAIEGVLYYFLLSQPFMRGFFAPLAIAVLAGAGIASWQTLRPRRQRNRRAQERRLQERRGMRDGAGE